MNSKVRSRLLSHKAFLFDLDGTLYLGGSLIPGSVKLIQKLRALKKKIIFFTNNSSRSDQEYFTKLKKLGFHPKRDEIIMSTHSLGEYLKSKSLNRVYLLGTPAMKSMLSRMQIKSVSALAKPKVVVVGFDKTLTYQKLLEAARLIDRGIPWVVTHPDYYCPTDEGPEPDCGAMAELLRLTTAVEPIAVLGKPHRLMMVGALKRCGVSAKDCILLGDRLSTDIAMARASGVTSALVLTGETTRASLRRSRVKPHYVLKSVADLL